MVPFTVKFGIVTGPVYTDPVRAGDVVYDVQFTDPPHMQMGLQLTRHLVDDDTLILPAPPGAIVAVSCVNDQCYGFVLGETVVFQECPAGG